MLLEKGRISNFQLLILIMGFVSGTFSLMTPGQDAGHDAWVAIVLGLMEGLCIAWIFTNLSRKFPDKTIIEINTLVYGRYLGKCISILFIWYLFHISAIVLSIFSTFLNVEIYHFTPKAVILLCMMLVCASTVNRGIEVLARLSLILVIISITLICLETLLLITHMDLKNLLPVMDIPVNKLLWVSHSVATNPFGEVVVFLMVFAFVDHPKKRFSTVALAMITAGSFLLIIIARNSMVLGQAALTSNFPTYLAVHMIDLGDILTRAEVVVAIDSIIMVLVKVSVLFYGTVMGVAQLFDLHSYRPLILPIGILMVIFAMTNFGNMIEMFAFVNKGHVLYAVPFQIGIPLITLIVARLRGLPPKWEVEN